MYEDRELDRVVERGEGTTRSTRAGEGKSTFEGPLRVSLLGDATAVALMARFAALRHREAGTALILVRQRLRVADVAVERQIIVLALLAVVVLALRGVEVARGRPVLAQFLRRRARVRVHVQLWLWVDAG